MEFVYVVSRDELFPDCYPQGLARFTAGESERGLGSTLERAQVLERIDKHGFFVERPYAERSPHLKQVIPYTVVVLEDAERGPLVLVVRRLPQGGEQRLVGKLSIGIGGHINPVDNDDDQHVAESGAIRELEEELFLSGERRVEAIGLINDDSNPVGAVHVGLVQVLYLGANGSVRVREEDVLEGTLVPPSELQRQLEEGANFETWSRMLVENLDELLSLTLPALS